MFRRNNAQQISITDLRRRMMVDNIPVCGYIASKVFMLKVGASNLIAFFGYQRRQRARS